MHSMCLSVCLSVHKYSTLRERERERESEEGGRERGREREIDGVYRLHSIKTHACGVKLSLSHVSAPLEFRRVRSPSA
jgi:hypothetical protein